MADVGADYIIVGGGLTGCIMASRLSQSAAKPSVVLIEAGPDPSGNPAVAAGFLGGLSLLGGALDYAYQSEPEPSTTGRTHTLPAGRALGGGSILNYGCWLRADAADYDDWARLVGDERWSYERLRPWLRKPERFHGAANVDGSELDHGYDGPMHVYAVSAVEAGTRQYPLRELVKQAWAEVGTPINLRREKGTIAGLAEMDENSRDGLRQPTYTAYPLDSVRVLTDTVVQRVTFSGTRATGVELADGRTMIASKEVIICAGAYRTPQVLMLSGIGPATTLGELGIPVVYDSPHVGQNLHDHYAIFFAFRLRDPTAGLAFGSPSWHDKPALLKSFPWDWVVSGPLPEDVMARHEADAALRDRNLWEALTAYIPPGIPGIPVDGTHIATSTMLLRPTSRGAVTIRSGRASDPPRIQPNYVSTALDRDALIYAARRTLQAVLATDALGAIVECETPPSGPGLDGLAPITVDATDDEIEERIRRTGSQHHHSGGTAAMGRVTDSQGRVLGVSGLRIADASIVPIPLGGHPQTTLHAMAEQLASLIINGDGAKEN